MGFWVGMFVSILFSISGTTFLENVIINFVACGWLASGTSYFLCMLLNDDGLKIQAKASSKTYNKRNT